MSRNMFIEAIKAEQRRIQRFIDLSRPCDGDRGSLYVQNQGGNLYAFERWQEKGKPLRKTYLGRIESEPVRELFSAKFIEKRFSCLQYDQKLLQKLERPCADEAALLDAAIAAGPRRVIIKRPPKGPYLAGRKPSFSIRGKAVRFDCIVPAPRG